MRLALAALAACSTAPAARPTPAVAALETEPIERPAVVQRANDDLPHRTRLLAPWLRPACVPPQSVMANSEPDDSNRVSIALDAIGDQLVACAQMVTRRGASVFSDPVSFACWDVSPATGVLAPRGDLGRGYFRCQDGTCTTESFVEPAPSYDGRELVKLDGRGVLTRWLRGADGARGAVVGTATLVGMATPDGSDERGWLQLIAMPGGVTLIDGNDSKLLAFDAQGHEIADVPAMPGAQIVDDTHVIAIRDPLDGSVVDLAARSVTEVSLPGCTADELARIVEPSGPCETVLAATHLTGAVRYRGQLYAIDDAGRRLVTLDPASYRATASKPLAVCTPP